MQYSRFGAKFSQYSGIMQLMDDMGRALSGGRDMIMLGGGNPAHIGEMEAIFRQEMQRIMQSEDQFEKMIGDYDPPQGNVECIEALSRLYQQTYDWPVTRENIALTNGSQTTFFMLLNLFAGEMKNSTTKKILLPILPEYIGYSDVGLNDDFFIAFKPKITEIDEHLYEYKIDFDRLQISSDIGAVCISRPTNPSGNVISDEEIAKLYDMTREHDIPLIIDSAYGAPFPNIVYKPAQPLWKPGMILCQSLSKFGLPSLRTGIVIADKEVITALERMNAIISLAPIRVGAGMVTHMIKNGEILRLSNEVIRPFYQKKADQAVEQLKSELKTSRFAIHQPQGAFFLWLWLKSSPVPSQELYLRLKEKEVLVVPGHYFFPGLQEPWQHQHECIRITYAGKDDITEKGLHIIAEEINTLYN
ncbi:valine--pyruvate transaminase [candidate division KSB1 bacterium]|nr:valine--pyruvate transaminase [candidate division KSB1 bacterium]